MPEKLSDKLREHLKLSEGRYIDIKDIRVSLKVEPGSNDDANLRKLMSGLFVEQKIVSSSGKKDGIYKVIRRVKPVRVFTPGRERRPPFKLFFPRDFDTGMEMNFADDIVIREGDCITIGGVSNQGKTCIALHLCGENIDCEPVLMGNEYTTRIGETEEFEPAPRFYNRLEAMDWVQWTNGTGGDRFLLLPVREDYAEHIVKDKINIIDWVNLDAGALYGISTLMENGKAEVGRGILVIVLQKSESSASPRGGQFAKDFSDCELLIDKYTETESLLTIGKVKEYNRTVSGRTFAFAIVKGVKIINFREVKKCKFCSGKGYTSKGECDICVKGYVDA